MEKIRQGLDQMPKLYANHGYINFTPVPGTTADGQSGTVSLAIDIDEGMQFRSGRLILPGAEVRPGAGAQLVENWKTA